MRKLIVTNYQTLPQIKGLHLYILSFTNSEDH